MKSKTETVLRAARLCLSGFCGYGETQCPYFPEDECRKSLIRDLVDVIEQRRKPYRSSIDPKAIQKATEMINDGASYKEVADALGYCRENLSYWKRKGLIPASPYKQFGRLKREGED